MPFDAPPYDHDHENEVTLFGETNFRNQNRRFGIKTDDRRRHMYVVGKTGMGKTTLLENMVLSDIYAGHGLAYIDPHGDTAKTLLDFIPSHRINDVVYVNPADMEFPIGFNILETIDENQKHLVAAGLMGVFKKIWPDVWSARMEYILLNTILALIDFPGSTLLGINRLLADEEYRKRVVSLIQDPVVKTFWVKEFASFSEKYRTEAIAPIQNKVGQFLSASIIRNIVAQVKSTISIREIMDTRKIFIVNLSKGLIGEENSRLLGAMIITRLQLSAMERVDMPEKDRQDFYLYVDEFQNFATESFANILSEARKYRLALIVAHQYIEQLEEEVRDAVFGNVGTLIAFRVGAADAAFMENEFMPRFTPEDLVNLTKFEIYLKLMIDGAASAPFSAKTLAPIAQRTGSTEKVVKVSRERYATPRKTIEERVIKWSGFGTTDTGEVLMTEEEREIEGRIKELETTSPDVGEMASPAGDFGAKKKKKAEFQIPCSVCGKISELTFEPDWSKPWFCKEHLELKSKGQLPRTAIKVLPKPPAPAAESRPMPPKAETEPVVTVPEAAPVSLSSLAPRPPASAGGGTASGGDDARKGGEQRQPRNPPHDERRSRDGKPGAAGSGLPAGRQGSAGKKDRRGKDGGSGDRSGGSGNQPGGAGKPPGGGVGQQGPRPPRDAAPVPGTGTSIPMAPHRPRIVVGGADDDQDIVLQPKEDKTKDDKPGTPHPDESRKHEKNEHRKDHDKPGAAGSGLPAGRQGSAGKDEGKPGGAKDDRPQHPPVSHEPPPKPPTPPPQTPPEPPPSSGAQQLKPGQVIKF